MSSPLSLTPGGICVPLASLFQGGRRATHLAALEKGRPVTLAELEHQVRRWHAAFAAAPGRRYVLHAVSALDFVAALFGAWFADKCPLLPSDLQVASIAGSGIPIDGYAGLPGAAHPAGQRVLTPLDPTVGPLPVLDPERAVLEMYTSGSTGQPTAIAKCLRQLEHEAAGLAAALDLGPPARRVLGTVSHQHMYGLMFRVLLPLASGRPFEAIRVPQVQDLARIEAPEGCVLVTSPAQLVRLPEPGPTTCRAGAVLSAGGPLGDDGVRACQDLFGVPVTEIYGSSETGAVAWRRRTPGLAGTWRPLPGVEFRSTEGVLEIRTRQLPTQDWFRSADRVIQGPDGFELAGRVDRIVKLEEKRVSLDEVERVLLSSGLLEKARALVLDRTPSQARPLLAVAGLPNAAGWALAQDGKRVLVERLRDHLRLSAQIEVLPRSWRFLDPWPVTPDGKTPEGLLRDRFDRRTPEFRLISRDAGGCEAELWVSPTTPFFAGHFVDQPILAGVVQIDWLVGLCRCLLGIQAGFAGLDSAKFRKVILPDTRLTVSLRHDPGAQRTAYQILRASQVCASGRIRWDGAS